jgi:hypothetical protein
VFAASRVLVRDVMPTARRICCALVLLLGGAACGSPKQIDPSTAALSPSIPAATESETPSTPSAGVTEHGWYEVDRVGDLEGNQNRTLLVGSLAGTLIARIPLDSQAPADRQEGREAFAWTDPQADGVFGGRALVWGREGNPTAIEAVDLADASIDELVQAPEAAIHVATADAELDHVFFITVDQASNRPTGVWVSIPEKGEQPVRLAHRFAPERVTNLFTYRLVAQADGSRLAVQAGEGPVTLIDVEGDQSVELEPGGPIIGFADGHLVAYGPRSPTGLQSVVAFDPATLAGRQIATEATAAQVVPGSAGDLVAVMHRDESNPTWFSIEAIQVDSGESRVAYIHETVDIGPVLARREMTFLGAELPIDWVLITDSFFPFIHQDGVSPRPLPESSYPILLNLRTSETLRVGPFVDQTGS